MADKEKIDKEDASVIFNIMRGFEVEHAYQRDIQLLLTKKGQYFFRGYQRLYYDALAKDYRDVTESPDYDPSIDDYYNKVVNVYRAHGEAVIAALSVDIPGVTFLPDDAENPEDIDTAKNFAHAALLIQRHNQASILFPYAIYTAWVSPLVAAYHYLDTDEKYGVHKSEKYKTEEKTKSVYVCSNCGYESGTDLPKCPECGSTEDFIQEDKVETVSRFDGYNNQPKSRVCIDVYGVETVKVSPYARKQSETPYLIMEFEEHVSEARARHPEEEIGPSANDSMANWERYSRDPQTFENLDWNRVTTRCVWLRPSAFYYFSSEQGEELRKKYPKGLYCEFINNKCVSMKEEALDDCWTIARFPTSSHIHSNPIGQPLFDPQEIENTIVNLNLETMEQAIPQTFADSEVLDFENYKNLELSPGMVVPVKARPNENVGQAFYTTRTASMSQEIDKFANRMQQASQLVVGAFPTIYGGSMQGGSKTYAEYAASRQQALQRLGLVYKAITIWWADVMSKCVPLYIDAMLEDERFVIEPTKGQFINLTILKDATSGKVGSVEPTAANQLPTSWAQQRDMVMELLRLNSDEINATLFSPDNAHLLVRLSGIPELVIPGDDSRTKQFREILMLIATEPTDDGEMITPSVTVDIEVDNHMVEASVCRMYLNSQAGQQLKAEQPDKYANVLAHMNEHLMALRGQMNPASQPSPEGEVPAQGGANSSPENAEVLVNG